MKNPYEEIQRKKSHTEEEWKQSLSELMKAQNKKDPYKEVFGNSLMTPAEANHGTLEVDYLPNHPQISEAQIEADYTLFQELRKKDMRKRRREEIEQARFKRENEALLYEAEMRDITYPNDSNDEFTWGGLYGEEAEAGYWNTH